MYFRTIREYRARSSKISEKREAVLKYNEFMGGVDRSDQLMSYYLCEGNTLTWYAKVVLHLFHVMMNNVSI